ncbi:hypothetical protein PLESTB_001501500 [Pleodorina starrii]|uniref:AB hydrolase-1 domain-containing protein n=1 Tax=Pleodorina starrii TaxID=330485 RepID=A0A9W6BXC1_9CHLO|nr:hypothetical protein PLESTB_001501500 [Pleodorina starrii]
MAPKEKRRYINYRVDEYLRDRFLQSGRKHKPREICGGGESLMRCFNHIKFCVVCCASLSQAVAPWMLCSLEILTVLLIYFLATSRSLVIHHHHFSFTRSLEDVVGLSCTRAAILSLAYAVGQRAVHRPYLYGSYLLAAACVPYLVVKTILFRYGPDGIAAASILVISGLCSVAHILAAKRTVDWARRRYQMGLAGFGMPWEEGDDLWLSLRRPDLEDVTKTSDGGGPDASDDVPAEMLADDDSKFVELEPGLKVHYKEVAPPAAAAAAASSGGGGGGAASPFYCGPDGATTGIVLVHGFGGGVFSWRHIMEALAMQCHCRVIAFDRPAFGLTSRPKATEQSNPYTVSSQSQLLLQLCSSLRLRHVVLMAHADGCLVTLRAAATSARYYQQRSAYVQPLQLTAPQHPMYEITQYMAASSAMAPERCRTAPSSSSTDSSPKLHAADVPASPATATDELLSPYQQQLQTFQQQASMQLPAAAAAGLSSGGGALSAAAFAAAASDAGGFPTGSGGGCGAGMGAGMQQQLVYVGSLTGGGGSVVSEPEAWRSVVAAEEVARTGSGSFHGGSAAQGAFALAAKCTAHANSIGGAPHHHHHLHPHPHTHSFCTVGCPGGPALGAAHSAPPPPPPPPVFVDLEAGSSRCETLEMDQASTTSTSFAAALATQAHHRRAQSVGAGSGCSTRNPEVWEVASSSSGSQHHYPPHHHHHHHHHSHQPQPPPVVLGLVLLHPNLSGVLGPPFSNVLARSQLGRSILRPLLRTEVGEVANRRAWHNTDKLTAEVLELYKKPLKVEGWDAALIETTRQRRESCLGDLPAHCRGVESIPTLIATGEHDRIVPPSKSESLGADLPHAHLAVLHDCGHLSHEEAPGALLEHLVPFCGEVLGQGYGGPGFGGLGFGAPAAAAPGAPSVYTR